MGIALALVAAGCGATGDTSSPTSGGGTSDTTSTTGGTTDERLPTAASPDEAVVRVIATACGTRVEAIATGVALSARRIATVAHTFEEAEMVAIVGPDGTERAAYVVWIDPDRDIAILESVDSGDLPWLALGPVDDGDAVSIISAAEEELATKPADVLRHVNLTLDGAGRRAALELDADIGPGDSGAPVVGPSGRVVGMVFATVRTEPRAWAIAAEELEAALAQPADGPLPLSC